MAQQQKKNVSKRKGKRTIKNKNERLIKIALIIVVAIFALIIYKIFDILVLSNDKYDLSGETYYQYFFGYTISRLLNSNLNDENFAVIDSNAEKSVLQKCYINESDNTVVIQKNTYAIIDNNGHIINNRRFDSVKIED